MIMTDKPDVERLVAMLDGFLSGVVAFSGGIRDYSASAFQIEFSGGETVGGALKKYFYWVEDLGLSPVEQLPGGIRDLEIQIRPLLLRSYLKIA